MPRPAVLPPLPPMPRPTRRRGFFDPLGGFRSWILMGISGLFHAYEMRNRGDHPADLGLVGVLDGLVHASQPEGTQRAALLRLDADRRANLRDLQRASHRHATSVT